MPNDQSENRLPQTLTHYYRRVSGPFRTLSDLSSDLAAGVINHLSQQEPLPRRLVTSHYLPGTYVDSPFHRYADGKDLSELPLSSLADLPTVVVRADSHRIDASAFDGLDVTGKAALIHTGWSQHWKTDAYFEGQFVAVDGGFGGDLAHAGLR